jgi:hypothetical protein
MGTKICMFCKQEKAEKQFKTYKAKNGERRRGNRCYRCVHLRDLDKNRANGRACYRKHAAQRKTANKAWQKANPERVNLYHRKRRLQRVIDRYQAVNS